jgi:hypothetical protein
VATYLAIGHIAVDLTPDGAHPGGTVIFAARQAQALGYDVRILTSTTTEVMESVAPLLTGIEIRNQESAVPTIFEYEWHATGRVQRLTSTAAMLRSVPDDWLASDIWHLAPVAGEIDPHILRPLPAKPFVGVTPQGWMRQTDSNSNVYPAHWEPSPELLSRTGAIVLSRQDIDDAEARAREWAAAGPVVVVTAAADGATVVTNAGAIHVPALPVSARNELGAGDVFATVLFTELYRGRPVSEASHTAAGAAAAMISDPSSRGFATREDISAAAGTRDVW